MLRLVSMDETKIEKQSQSMPSLRSCQLLAGLLSCSNPFLSNRSGGAVTPKPLAFGKYATHFPHLFSAKRCAASSVTHCFIVLHHGL